MHRWRLAWLWRKPGVIAPIVGATKASHVEDALAAEQLTLSEEEGRPARRSSTSRTAVAGNEMIVRPWLDGPYRPWPFAGHLRDVSEPRCLTRV